MDKSLKRSVKHKGHHNTTINTCGHCKTHQLRRREETASAQPLAPAPLLAITSEQRDLLDPADAVRRRNPLALLSLCIQYLPHVPAIFGWATCANETCWSHYRKWWERNESRRAGGLSGDNSFLSSSLCATVVAANFNAMCSPETALWMRARTTASSSDTVRPLLWIGGLISSPWRSSLSPKTN